MRRVTSSLMIAVNDCWLLGSLRRAASFIPTRLSVRVGNVRHVTKGQRGQVTFLGKSTVRQPRLSVGSSFPWCSRRIVDALKCHDQVKVHVVRDWLASAVDSVKLVVVNDEKRAVFRLPPECRRNTTTLVHSVAVRLPTSLRRCPTRTPSCAH